MYTCTNKYTNLIIDHKGAVWVFESCVSSENGVVGLNHSRGDLWRGVDGELELWFFAVVHRQALHEEGGETRAGAPAKRVEDQKALKPCAHVSQLADAVKDEVDDFLTRVVIYRL